MYLIAFDSHDYDCLAQKQAYHSFNRYNNLLSDLLGSSYHNLNNTVYTYKNDYTRNDGTNVKVDSKNVYINEKGVYDVNLAMITRDLESGCNENMIRLSVADRSKIGFYYFEIAMSYDSSDSNKLEAISKYLDLFKSGGFESVYHHIAKEFGYELSKENRKVLVSKNNNDKKIEWVGLTFVEFIAKQTELGVDILMVWKLPNYRIVDDSQMPDKQYVFFDRIYDYSDDECVLLNDDKVMGEIKQCILNKRFVN